MHIGMVISSAMTEAVWQNYIFPTIVLKFLSPHSLNSINRQTQYSPGLFNKLFNILVLRRFFSLCKPIEGCVPSAHFSIRRELKSIPLSILICIGQALHEMIISRTRIKRSESKYLSTSIHYALWLKSSSIINVRNYLPLAKLSLIIKIVHQRNQRELPVLACPFTH